MTAGSCSTARPGRSSPTSRSSDAATWRRRRRSASHDRSGQIVSTCRSCPPSWRRTGCPPLSRAWTRAARGRGRSRPLGPARGSAGEGGCAMPLIEFEEGTSFMHRLDPLSKLAWSFVVLLWLLTLRDPVPVLAVGLAVVAVGALLGGLSALALLG